MTALSIIAPILFVAMGIVLYVTQEDQRSFLRWTGLSVLVTVGLIAWLWVSVN